MGLHKPARIILIGTHVGRHAQTVLISQPAEDEGATVIWLLDEEETDAQPATGEDPI